MQTEDDMIDQWLAQRGFAGARGECVKSDLGLVNMHILFKQDPEYEEARSQYWQAKEAARERLQEIGLLPLLPSRHATGFLT